MVNNGGFWCNHWSFLFSSTERLRPRNPRQVRNYALAGMSPLELSSPVMDIPNDAYTTLIQNVVGCSILCQEYPTLFG